MPHLFSILREAGYRQGLIGKNHWPPDAALPGLFETVVEADHVSLHHPPTPEAAEVGAWMRRPELVRAPWGAEVNPYPPRHCPTALLADAALDFLRTARERPEPFCAWLSFPEPHTPLQAPEEYAALFSPDVVPLPRVSPAEYGQKPLRQQIARRMFASEQVPEAVVRRAISMYYAMERFVDDQLGRVLEYLRGSGLAEDTLVVFTTDHGTYLGEHGLVRKSLAFYDCLLRVPLVFCWPGRVATGARLAWPVSLVDVVPTALDVLGVARPESLDRPALLATDGRPRVPDGPSAVYAEAGAPGDPPTWSDLKDVPADPLDGRFTVWGGRVECWTGPARMMRTVDAKLARYDSGESEVYDLRGDPGELVNLAGTNRGRVLEDRLAPLLDQLTPA